MDKIEKWKSAKRSLEAAKKHLAYIGKTTSSSTLAQREGTAATTGKLASLTVASEMHFQEFDGDQNYHKCQEFDAAFARVVIERFEELKVDAIKLLERDVTDAAQDARSELEDWLAEIPAVSNAA